MSGFSPDWLALREPADHRDRNADLAEALAGRFALRPHVDVVDVGCGTGSNLRATCQLLPDRQNWTLVDYDSGLLAVAARTLGNWADKAHRNTDGTLDLEVGRRRIHVAFRKADLAHDLETGLGEKADLVTAAAFFDLASTDFIRRFVDAVARRNAVFYTVLTYNGIQSWSPRHPDDNRITAAFNRHQMTDKGFGTSAGPTAPAHLADQFRLAGYSVLEGDSPWRLAAPRDAALMKELIEGQASAVAETKALDAKAIERWLGWKRTALEVGHTDTLAVPPGSGGGGIAETD